MFHTLTARSLAAIGGIALGLWSLACEDYSVPKDSSGTFAACCDGLGMCVATGLVATDRAQSLSQDSCGKNLLCAPRELLVQGRGYPPACTVSATGAEGRCLPACLPELASRPGLREDGCSAGRLCAPCFDPLDGTRSSACQLGNDPGPREPAVVFDACCGDLGRCVPAELVDERDRPRLDREQCDNEQSLCAPRALARSKRWQPQPCNEPATGAEGRCLPACLPEVARHASRLTRGPCTSGQLCAPCFDPVSGEDTGACALGADPGPSEPRQVLDTCCGELGRCVPGAWLQSDERAHLARLDCGSGEALCVPELLARDEHATPRRCEVAGTRAEGRCLPACLPEVARREQHLERDVCEQGELCAPCFDPVSGEVTGACDLGGDGGPQEPAHVFAHCCGDLGRCVPIELVPATDRKRLGPDSCAQERELCAPEGLVRADDYVAASCSMHATHAEGRCLPACLPELAARADVLAQDGCAAGELCGVCFDPTDGRNTGACNLGGDPGPATAPAQFGRCCGQLGRCVPGELIPERDRARLARSECSAQADLCLPEPLLLDADHVFERCTTFATGVEGRCLPGCLPDVHARADDLRQQSCAADHLCTPCFDPFDGTRTGACNLGGDPGPSESPMPFGACCGGLGRCVPQPLLSSEERAQLGKDSCGSDRDLCAPEPLARDPGHVFASCKQQATGAEGRCLPACLPRVAARASQLAQDGCAAAELCTPCFDPVDGNGTGACELGGDPGASQPPLLFASCAGGAGKCVPGTLVRAADRSHLARESCTSADALCVPTELARATDHRFGSCSVGATGAEGRCLPAFLPDVAARAAQLSADGCASGQLCTPCFEPVDGKSTGACALGGDPGPARAPTVFASCCDALGRCVPASFVEDATQSRLGRDSCSDQGALCVPLGLARDARYAFASCATSATGGEGRCLPACLPEVAARAEQLREDGCGTGNRCAPCYEPVDGAATGACTLGGDTGPVRAASLFATCCGEVGRCVPLELVADSDEAQLARDSCRETNDLCVPASLARDARHVFATCSDGNTGGEGRCLPSCLPAVAARAGDLTRSSCASSELCAPCYDPLSGETTGACAIGGDTGPARAPTTYPHCCSDAGRCIVASQVPQASRDKLGADGCNAQSAQLCVPLSLARDPAAPPATCHDSATGAEGRCLMQCLPQVAPQASRLRQSGCGGGELCVPCYDPVSGDSTGACSFSAADPGPSEAKLVFEACCGSGGLCVPQQLLPGGSSNLSAQSCTRAGYVCAPRALVAEPNGRLPSCTSVLGPSVCVASCFVPAGLGDVLPAGGCSAEDKCVPCWAASGLCP